MEIPVLSYIRTVGTHEESVSREWKNRCKLRSRQIGKSVWQGDVVMRSEFIVVKFPNPYCREKPLLLISYPYRKPTQVDEERILRPTEEALLRNSAK